MKEELIRRLTLMHTNLMNEATEARTRGGTMAMKIGSRAKLIKETIDFLEKYRFYAVCKDHRHRHFEF